MTKRKQVDWEAVQTAYETGESATSLAKRFKVGRSTIGRHRAAGGWKRASPVDTQLATARRAVDLKWEERKPALIDDLGLTAQNLRGTTETILRRFHDGEIARSTIIGEGENTQLIRHPVSPKDLADFSTAVERMSRALSNVTQTLNLVGGEATARVEHIGTATPTPEGKEARLAELIRTGQVATLDAKRAAKAAAG